MAIHLVKKIPTAKELQEEIPMTAELKKVKEERDRMIRHVFVGELW